MRWFVLLTVGLVLAACGGGGSENDQAAASVKRYIGYLNAGQYRRAYDMVHPAEQAFIPYEAFERCTRERLKNVASLSTGKVQEVYDEPLHVDGTDITAPSKAVTYQVMVAGAGQQTTTITTSHVIKVGDGWRVTASGADAYKQGNCPA